jgi:imidazolonepropionase-like amidohydrolase
VNQFIPNQDVIIKNGKSVSISQNQATVNSAAVKIDGTGQFLIPGLVDSHVHLKESKNDMLLYLVSGVTYVREMA